MTAIVEGSVWEAVEVARQAGLDNLCAIVDINRLGQSDPTMLQHDMEAYRSRWAGFGWHAIVVDGHDIPALLAAFDEAARTGARQSSSPGLSEPWDFVRRKLSGLA
ncbi:MAG: hypothetical protein U0361_02155 [Nitrospiraceae bacterium]